VHIEMATSVTFVIAKIRSRRIDGRDPFLNSKSVWSKHSFRLNKSRLDDEICRALLLRSPKWHRLPRWERNLEGERKAVSYG